jgi:hypothetical protein
MVAVGGSGSGNGQPGGGGGQNPFQFATNWYAEKIVSTLTGIPTSLGTGQIPFFIQINPGNFYRGTRFIVRSSGATGGAPTADAPTNLFAALDTENTDGAEILYNMGGYAHEQVQTFGRPWYGNLRQSYDFSAGPNPSFTLFLSTEIRNTAGVLANTDSRSQYRHTGSLATAATVASGLTGTLAVTVTPYMDCYAQPDAADLQGVANEPLPEGLNLQVKRRHEIPSLNTAGADNIIQTHETGNLIRLEVLITRDANSNRQEALTDPIRWQVDNRNLGTFSPDMLRQWNKDQYANYYGSFVSPAGVYLFPRYWNPGDMTGQGWLETNSSTKITHESSTAAGIIGSGTMEIITDEVIPVNQFGFDLVHI